MGVIMAKIKVGELDAKLRAASIVVETVRLTADQKIELVFTDGTSDSVKAQALTIVASYDQAAEDAKKIVTVPQSKDIKESKNVAELADKVDKLTELVTLLLAKNGML